MTSPNIRTIKSEILIHTVINTHQNPRSIAILEDLDSTELSKYDFVCNCSSELKNNLDGVITRYDKDYLYTISSLNDEGIAIFSMDNYSPKELKLALEKLSFAFDIIMPFMIPFADCSVYIFCSKKYHPTADLQLQRADMLDNLKFYTPYIQKAMFEQPRFFFGYFEGLIKN